MKKILAILLALMMVLVSVVALAADGDPTDEINKEDQEAGGDAANSEMSGYIKDATTSIDPTTIASAGTPTVAGDVEISKKFNVEAYANGNQPALSLTFTATQKSVELSTETTAPKVTINGGAAIPVAEGTDKVTLTINLPSYKAVGIYTYTVTETATNVAGMVDATNLELKVTVVQDVANNQLYIGGIAFRQEDKKTDEIENLYKAGSLEVKKIVDGNMGDRTKDFPITIVLTAPTGKTVASTITYTKTAQNGTTSTGTVTWSGSTGTVNINLKHNETIQIDNIPDGVTYAVSEDDTIVHLNDSKEQQDNADAYKVVVDDKGDGTIAGSEIDKVEITNTKDIDIDTGVALDSTVYMLIMALALAGFVALKVRRREEY